MERIRLSFSYANVMATIAVFLALGGGTYAALKLPRNSVGPSQIKNNAVTAAKVKRNAITNAKLANGAVTGVKVLDNSLTGPDINVATLGKVPLAAAADTASNATNAGHATAADSATSAATATALSSVTYAVDTSAGPVDVPKCASDPCTPDQVGTTFAIAVCPTGTTAISGGGVTQDPGVELAGSFPTSVAGFSAWEVDVDNYLQTPSKVHYFAVCAPVGSIGTFGPIGRTAQTRRWHDR